MRRSTCIAFIVALLAVGGLSLIASRPAATAGPAARAAIYVVSDPRLSSGQAAEIAMTTILLSLRQKYGIEGSLLPVNTYHLDSSEEATFAHEKLRVSDQQVPFVGLAELNASGQPGRFLLRLGPVHNASAAGRLILDRASLLFGEDSNLLKNLPPVTAQDLTVAATDGLAQSRTGAISDIPSPIVTHPDQAEMVLIPAGEFIMGSNIMDDEEPSRTLFLTPYYIDRYAVTNRQFELFVQATHYVTDAERKGFSIIFVKGEPVARDFANWRQPLGPGSASIAGFENHPVVHVSWNDAHAYALWANKRLPTEMEWEKAARGIDGREYPWGAAIDESRSNSRYFAKGDIIRTMNPLDHGRGTIPVGSLPDGASPYGVMDLGGNVEEWVEDWYHSYPGNTRPVDSGGGSEKVKRGGGWNDEPFWSSYRAHSYPSFSSDETGFRTCQSVHSDTPATTP